MTHYIVDASIMAQIVITDTHTNETKQLFKGAGKRDKLFVPEFGLLECTNVIWKQVRFHSLSVDAAEKLVEILIALDVVITPATGLMPRALEIGITHKLAVYDSMYIALAENLKYPLITDDRKQAKAAAAEGITLKPITDFTSEES